LDALEIDWIWKLSMTRPKDSISWEQRSRTCWENLSWSLIMSSTVIEPAIARRYTLGPLAGAEAGDDQGLVRLGHSPGDPEHDEDAKQDC